MFRSPFTASAKSMASTQIAGSARRRLHGAPDALIDVA
jgi:hypothetical protein